MAELFRQTDEYGDRVKVFSLNDGGLMVVISREDSEPVNSAVEFVEADGLRLLGALQRYYATSEEKDGTP
jgi:hypothetical protein